MKFKLNLYVNIMDEQQAKKRLKTEPPQQQQIDLTCREKMDNDDISSIASSSLLSTVPEFHFNDENITKIVCPVKMVQKCECGCKCCSRSHILKYTMHVETASPPVQTTPDAAGYDIACSDDVLIEPDSQALVPTGLSFVIPEGCHAEIAIKSKFAIAWGLYIDQRVVENPGEPLEIYVRNCTKTAVHLTPGMYFAQLILQRHIIVQSIVNTCSDVLDSGIRKTPKWITDHDPNKQKQNT